MAPQILGVGVRYILFVECDKSVVEIPGVFGLTLFGT
jgi:hypothetical protein